MGKYHEIDLTEKFPPAHTLTFLRALIPSTLDSPIALIMYALEGEEQELGIRLDLNKQNFIDHPFDAGSNLDKISRTSSTAIALFVKKKYCQLRVQSYDVENNINPMELCAQH